ncbi:hypothetical protein TRIATDRAFT_318979 [Trichoderma atroviride IMI 206040]|uniref:Uncharacterized protein n=1 Tax=Hypocrea atroviridis (strain ATCC 20476 / IMI 206040) TaxID=452589 RepID=G9NX54_HYPAI|nr:uncharacterized protein TRIATDRAFT_318979 [Trichoderma atroviride IMI 206040]EHK45486.1 hypothetical protein TRIATDRAFT_318979 [Trichoderma atroviride IMI 206040]
MPDICNPHKWQAHRFGPKSQLSARSELDMDLWYELAQSYSRLSLTNAGNHLNAIAGIVTEFSKAMSRSSFSESAVTLLESTWHESYVSGLWLPNIQHGLLWRGASEMLKVCDCGAPSWSWLVFKGQAVWPQRYDYDNIINHCEIISIIRGMGQNSALYLITMADMLYIKGKIQPAIACGRLTAALDKDLAILTGEMDYAREIENRAREISTYKAAAEPGFQGHQVRQLICPITAATAAAGWGTFERPDLLRP